MKKTMFLFIMCIMIAVLSGCTANTSPQSEKSAVPVASSESTAPVATASPTPEPSDFVCSLLENGTGVEITKYTGSDQDLEIPETINGSPVVSIADCAFVSNPALMSVSIPKTVAHIGINPFLDCKNLSSISVSPDNSAFETIGEVLYSKDDKTLISYPAAKAQEEFVIPQGVKAIGSDACFGCPMSTVTFPDTLVSIGDRAFAHSANLRTIHMPGSVKHIGNSAFGVCQKLQSFAIPEGVESIGDWAFTNSLEMSWISLPGTLQHMGKNPFYDCTMLYEITVSENNPYFETIDRVLVNKTDHTLICYPKNDSFAKEYSIPQGIVTIGERAFFGCNWGTSLKKVTIPDSVVSIEAHAFAYSSIEQINLPQSISFIGENAFYHCYPLSVEVAESSYAERYFIENGPDYVVVQSSL